SAAEAAASPATASAPSHHVTENHSSQESRATTAPAASADTPDDPQKRKEAEDEKRERDAPRRWSRPPNPTLDAAVGSQINSLGLRDPLPILLGGGQQRTRIIPLAQNRPDVSQNITCVTVRNDRFEAVPDLCPVLVVLDGKKNENSFVLALLSNS